MWLSMVLPLFVGGLLGIRIWEGIAMTYEHRSRISGRGMVYAVTIGWIDHHPDTV